MSIAIRGATPADDGPVGDLLVEAYQSQYALKMPDVVLPEGRITDLRDQASRRAIATVLVGEEEGVVVGTVALYRWGAPTSEAWIPGAVDLRLLAVAASHRGRGVAEKMLDETERLGREWEAPALSLHVRRGAEGVARLYTRRGYERDPSGDIDHSSALFLDAYVLPLRR